MLEDNYSSNIIYINILEWLWPCLWAASHNMIAGASGFIPVLTQQARVSAARVPSSRFAILTPPFTRMAYYARRRASPSSHSEPHNHQQRSGAHRWSSFELQASCRQARRVAKRTVNFEARLSHRTSLSADVIVLAAFSHTLAHQTLLWAFLASPQCNSDEISTCKSGKQTKVLGK